MEAGTHEFESHTSEVQIRIRASTLPELFEEAGAALADVILGEDHPAAPLDVEPEVIEVQAYDYEALLVDWLNELIYRSEVRKQVYTDVDVESLTERGLRARVRGFHPEEIKTAVKAATFHGLEIREHEDGFGATLVLDV